MKLFVVSPRLFLGTGAIILGAALLSGAFCSSSACESKRPKCMRGAAMQNAVQVQDNAQQDVNADEEAPARPPCHGGY